MREYSFNDTEYTFMCISALITEMCINNKYDDDMLDEYLLAVYNDNALEQCKIYVNELLACYRDKYDDAIDVINEIQETFDTIEFIGIDSILQRGDKNEL